MRVGVARTGGTAGVLVLAALAVAAPSDPADPALAAADAASAARGLGIELELRSNDQARILKRGKLRVRARTSGLPSTAPAFSTLKAKSKDPRGKKRIARKREAKLGPNWKRLRLKLSKRGRHRLERCVAQTLVIRASGIFEGDIIVAGSLRQAMSLTLPRCTRKDGPEPSPVRAYEVSPGGDATHANNTPRELAVTGTGADAVRLALFECANLSPAGGDVSFAAQDGVAPQGDPGAGFESVNGDAIGGAPPSTGPVAAEGAEIAAEISGVDGCATLVVFRDSNGNAGLDVDADGIPTELYGAGGETSFEPLGDVQLGATDRCDNLDPAVCLLPWPNDHFTIVDPSTDTGRRVSLQTASMPRNRLGVPINPGDYNRNDGFSPGQEIVTKVPGLDSQEALDATGAPPITDIERSLDADSPVVVIDADTGERQLIWSEVDANPSDPADVALLIRPAVNFAEGHRYIVALRDLKTADGQPIPAQRPFEIYRDQVITDEPAIETRRTHFEDLFATLGDAGVGRDELYLAWDFTVASERNLSERMLSIRDDAFAQLGDTDLADLEVEGKAPTYVVTGVTDYAPCGNDGCGGGLPIDLPDLGPISPLDLPLVGGIIGPTVDQLANLLGIPPEDDQIKRKIEGQFLVPCYTNLPLCPPGAQFQFGSAADNTPDRIPGNVGLANFTCIIPRSAVDDGVDPARPSLYGHGLLGAAGEVDAGNVKAMANEHNFVFCATDWAGFATQDLPTILLTLQDLSNFPKLADRMQQGYLNAMFLGRLMIHPQGFSATPAFRFGGQSVIDRSRLFFDGNSQGGIMGGGLTAVAPDFERAVLGVPGMNYSTLLRRSSDFAPYAEGEFVEGVDTDLGLYDSYPNELERPLILSMMQMLWDRGEANGYAQHMTSDPLPNTPPHEVLMHVAYGDHQVSMWTAEAEARTIGASRYAPTTDPLRHPDSNPYFGIPAIGAFPFDGSALVVWDSGPPRAGDEGVLPPPTTNTPPGSPEFGRDPHSDPRSTATARLQKSEFLRIGGQVINVCGSAPCYAHGWTGP